MDAETNQESWQVEANGEIFDTNFAEMTAWINEGSLLRIDRVRKGNLRWIEAGKVPTLIEFFNAKDAAAPLPPIVSTTNTEILGVADQPHQFVNQSAKTQSSIPDSDACSMHPDVMAVYVCDTCANLFCKACPNSYGGTVKVCPFCGALCKSVAQVEQARSETVKRSTAVGEGFGFGDFANAFAYPFKFKASLIVGAVMFMLFSIGQSAVSFGGIYMLGGAIFSFMLANTLTFGVLANTVENFSQGKIGLNFMPSFEDFSVWDDVIHPFFLSIGVYIASFGPLIAVALVAFFMVISSVNKEMNGLQSDASRTVAPELPYAANAVQQSERVKELLKKDSDQQKARVETMENSTTQPDASNTQPKVIDESELNVERANQLIQQQRKAQLESVVGKTPETVATERTALIKKVLGYGVLFLLLAGICTLWGLFYFPAACAIAGYTRSFAATLNPAVGFDTIRRLGVDYVKILLMGLVVAVMTGFIGGVLSLLLSAFDMPGVGNVPARAIGSLFSFYFSVVFSCVIGFALFKASDRLKLPI